MKQTSIEWLIEQYNQYRPGQMPNTLFKEVCEQAIKMHKQEIIDAHGEDRSYLQDDGSWKRINGEQYYSETFKKD